MLIGCRTPSLQGQLDPSPLLGVVKVDIGLCMPALSPDGTFIAAVNPAKADYPDFACPVRRMYFSATCGYQARKRAHGLLGMDAIRKASGAADRIPSRGGRL